MKVSFDIPYIKLKFSTKIVSDTKMPAFKVAALRGGMGEMLLRQNCVSDRNCQVCRFRDACVVMHTFYSYMPSKPSYVTGKESVGYLIECGDVRENFPKGNEFEFSLLLFGESIVFFNLFLQAFTQLGMEGIGRWKARFWIAEVKNTEGIPIVRRESGDMRNYQIKNLRDYVLRRKQELSGRKTYVMRFLTPLSMKYQKNYMKEFYSEALVKGAARRIQMLNYYLGQEAELPDFTEYPKIHSQEVKYAAVNRYSSTQDIRMTFYGIKGKIIFDWIPETCLEYLLAGELTHMGKNISFGFGQYMFLKDHLQGREDEENSR